MTIANLNDLGTTPLDDQVDMANLPDQSRQFPDPPQPGSYRFRMPRLTPANFEPVQTDKGPKVKVKFDDNAPLLIVQSPGGVTNNEPFTTQLSNVTRERGKKGSGTFASDWDYLNQALGHTTRPATNKAFAEQLIADSQKEGGAEFGADVEFNWHCNNSRDAYFPKLDPATQQPTTELEKIPAVDPTTGQPTGKFHQGCGTRYYQKDVDKVDGKYPVRIICKKCTAQVRAFANLTRFRA